MGFSHSGFGADYSRYVERVYEEMVPAPRAQSYAAAIEKVRAVSPVTARPIQ